MKTITPEELYNQLSHKSDLSVIDVRTPAEFASAHVHQAVNFPLDEISPKALVTNGTLPGGSPVYILCHSGKRAVKAAEKFSAEGFDNAVVVTGGTQAWIEAGLPVDEGSEKTISLERQVRIAAGVLVLTGVTLGTFVHPGLYVISAFVGAGLVFAGITDWCGMGLLLARAPWNKHRSA